VQVYESVKCIPKSDLVRLRWVKVKTKCGCGQRLAWKTKRDM